MELLKKCMLVGVLFWISSVTAKPLLKSSEFTLTLLHTNDIHGRFLETSQDSLACSESDSKAGKCYGGYARMFTKVGNLNDLKL